MTALGFMSLSVLIYSFIPLAVLLSGAAGSPFIFNGFWRLGVAFGCLFAALLLYRRLSRNYGFAGASWREVGLCSARSRFLPLCLLGGLDYALFAFSLDFLDASVAVALMETWPTLFVAFSVLLLRGEDRPRGASTALALLSMLVSMAGMALAVFSEEGRLSASFSLPGILLGLGCAACAACAAFQIRLGRDLADRFPAGNQVLATFCFVALVSGLSSLSGSLLSLTAGFLLRETMLPYASSLAALGGGLLLHCAASLLFRAANLLTRNLSLNGINFLIPALGIAWLWLFQGAGMARADWFATALLLVIAANALSGSLLWRRRTASAA